MTMEELRRYAREVEWVAQQGAGEAHQGFVQDVGRFRELVTVARTSLARGMPVEKTQALGIRTLAAALLKEQ
jgi:hypothetical protein